MNRDQKKITIFSLGILALLLALLFVKVDNSKVVLAIVLLPVALLTFFAIKKRGIYSVNSREVILLTSVISILIVILLGCLGIYFGYDKR